MQQKPIAFRNKSKNDFYKLKNISLVVVTSLLLMTGCDKKIDNSTQSDTDTNISATTQENTNSEVVETVEKNPNWETYIVATDPSNAPFEIRNEHGLVEGFDVDLINAIAQAEGFNVDVIPQNWSGIFESLDSGEKDILIAPLTINAERDELVDFTIPYIYPTRTAYLLPKTAEKLKIKSYQDLTKGTVAAKKETTNVTSLEKDFGADNIKIEPVDSQYRALTSVVSGVTDAGFGDTAVLQYHAGNIPDVEFVTIEQPLSEPVRAGFAVKNGNQELKKKLDDGIKKVIDDGTYRKIAVKWFGEELGNQITDRTIKYSQQDSQNK